MFFKFNHHFCCFGKCTKNFLFPFSMSTAGQVTDLTLTKLSVRFISFVWIWIWLLVHCMNGLSFLQIYSLIWCLKTWLTVVLVSSLVPLRSLSYPACLSVLHHPEHHPLGRLTSAPLTSASWPPLHFFSFCLLLPDRDGADCVSLTASAAPIPQGAPLTMTCLSYRKPVTRSKARGEKVRLGGHLGGGEEDQWEDGDSGEADARP